MRPVANALLAAVLAPPFYSPASVLQHTHHSQQREPKILLFSKIITRNVAKAWKQQSSRFHLLTLPHPEQSRTLKRTEGVVSDHAVLYCRG